MKRKLFIAAQQIAFGCIGGLFIMVGPILDAVSRH